LRVSVRPVGVFGIGWETFYTRMGKDGRITLPKLVRELLRARMGVPKFRSLGIMGSRINCYNSFRLFVCKAIMR